MMDNNSSLFPSLLTILPKNKAKLPPRTLFHKPSGIRAN